MNRSDYSSSRQIVKSKMHSQAFVPLPTLFRSGSGDLHCFAGSRVSRLHASRLHAKEVDRIPWSCPTATTSIPNSEVSSASKKSVPAYSSPIPTAFTKSTYDYIIVGGGAAGCVLANRLSADSSNNVLLIETGPSSSSFLINMPLGFPKLLGSPWDAAFITHPEPHLADRRLYFPRGRMVGGSHAISVMLYHRGHPYDYNLWERAAGESWSADAVAPYFLRSQTQLASDKRDSPHHGNHGPLPVSDLRRVNPMTSAFLDAAVSQGLPRNTDFNDWNHDQSGVGQFQVTQRDGNRATPATTYLASARGRRNLTVYSETIVERILFETSSSNEPVAVGVSIADSKGRRRTIRASKEIILSSGVYGSPQLLMLSGIGPGKHLTSHGIPVVVDSPSVGQNLQDHAASMLTFHSQNPYADKRHSSTYYTEATGKNVGTLLNYLFRGRGPLTSPMCEAGAFVRTQNDLQACDLQIRFIPFFSEPDPYASLADFANGGNYLENKSNRPAGFSLQSVVARPQSRGSVELRSGDARDSMLIQANWMSDERDLRTLVEGTKLCRQIAGDDAFNPYRGEEQYPGPNCISNEDLEAYVRETCHTANAMVGTCSMGKSSDSVVDAELRVRGVQRLRVIDSSVMPTLPGGQSGAPTMMVAEKGADIVLSSARTERSAVSVSSAP